MDHNSDFYCLASTEPRLTNYDIAHICCVFLVQYKKPYQQNCFPDLSFEIYLVAWIQCLNLLKIPSRPLSSKSIFTLYCSFLMSKHWIKILYAALSGRHLVLFISKAKCSASFINPSLRRTPINMLKRTALECKPMEGNPLKMFIPILSFPFLHLHR